MRNISFLTKAKAVTQQDAQLLEMNEMHKDINVSERDYRIKPAWVHCFKTQQIRQTHFHMPYCTTNKKIKK